MYFLIEMFLTESFVAEYICSCRLCNLGEMYNKIKYIKFFSFKKLNAKCLVSPYVEKKLTESQVLGVSTGCGRSLQPEWEASECQHHGVAQLIVPKTEWLRCLF